MSIRPTRVEIQLDALAHNLRVILGITGVPVLAVVKADAYGHGAPGVALALQDAGVAGFGVSLVEEGVQLRDAGVTAPVLVLGPALHHGGHEEVVAKDLTPVVSDVADLHALAEVGRRRGRPVSVHLKVDTGMGRLGIAEARVGDVIADARRGGVEIVGLMTHFACADSDDPTRPDCMTATQIARFAEVERVARAAGAPLRVRHAANSSGAMAFPAARLDLVRVGLALYGNGHWPVDDAQPAPRRQAMRLVTEVVQLRDVPAGSVVGYGGLWRATADTRVAVLPLGYADGLPRRATGRAEALIHGVRCPLVGAISMDLAIADVGAIADRVAPGDQAVLLGDGISVAEYATWSGLTEYEVTCGMSKRVPRVYR